MIGKTNLIQANEFKTGLVTRADIINPDPNQSPNCMDVKWYFDNVIGKRYGSSTSNSVVLSPASAIGSGTFIVQQSLTSQLVAYWKLDEGGGDRVDSFAGNNLAEIDPIASTSAIRNFGAVFPLSVSESKTLYRASANLINSSGQNYTVAGWVRFVDVNSSGSIAGIGNTLSATSNTVFSLINNGASLRFGARMVGAGSNESVTVTASSFGTPVNNTWYHIVGWVSNGHHVGISVNLSATTALQVGSTSFASTSGFMCLGQILTTDTATLETSSPVATLDEWGIWNRVLTSTERAQLYANGTGNTFTPSNASFLDTWYSFDFGASGIRWLTVGVGTGVLASSNCGSTFVNIATTRTANYQYYDRSRNVLILTSDSYDRTLYWAGSAGTFAANLALNSAPSAKFSINYQGFLVLLNSMDSNGVISNRRFSYADENTQLSSTWPDSFDLPSSADDEITGPFILNKFLYVSTKFRIFRLNYTGGNPDWSYIQVANFGFVPRTIKVFSLRGIQVAAGLDWSRRLRIFYGSQDDIVSDNVENYNNYCDFAMQRISLAGSGLLVSNAEFDTNQQEYRLNLSVGPQSIRTTHSLILNARTLSLYPYSNQPYNTLCMAESAGRQFLMAFDGSGYCHIMNSGNLDANTTPINEVYDTPLLYSKSPSEVSKNRQVNFFFNTDSCGKVYYQERFDFSNVFSEMRPLRDYSGDTELRGTESSLVITKTTDIPSVQNIYQGRLTSSSGTANPWKLIHMDLFNSGLGYGRGK